jgi:hypothetical protein
VIVAPMGNVLTDWWDRLGRGEGAATSFGTPVDLRPINGPSLTGTPPAVLGWESGLVDPASIDAALAVQLNRQKEINSRFVNTTLGSEIGGALFSGGQAAANAVASLPWGWIAAGAGVLAVLAVRR